MSAADPDERSANVLPSPANPFSTGGGGHVFEFDVDASLVATLLVRGLLPCLPASQVTAVHLQAGHLGLRTDDVMCEAVDAQRAAADFASQASDPGFLDERGIQRTAGESVSLFGDEWVGPSWRRRLCVEKGLSSKSWLYAFGPS